MITAVFVKHYGTKPERGVGEERGLLSRSGELEWRSGENARVPLMRPSFDSCPVLYVG